MDFKRIAVESVDAEIGLVDFGDIDGFGFDIGIEADDEVFLRAVAVTNMNLARRDTPKVSRSGTIFDDGSPAAMIGLNDHPLADDALLIGGWLVLVLHRLRLATHCRGDEYAERERRQAKFIHHDD